MADGQDSERAWLSVVGDDFRRLADNGASAFASMTLSYEKWLAFIKGPGEAVSMVVDSKGIRSGVEESIENDEGGTNETG